MAGTYVPDEEHQDLEVIRRNGWRYLARVGSSRPVARHPFSRRERPSSCWSTRAYRAALIQHQSTEPEFSRLGWMQLFLTWQRGGFCGCLGEALRFAREVLTMGKDMWCGARSLRAYLVHLSCIKPGRGVASVSPGGEQSLNTMPGTVSH